MMADQMNKRPFNPCVYICTCLNCLLENFVANYLSQDIKLHRLNKIFFACGLNDPEPPIHLIVDRTNFEN